MLLSQTIAAQSSSQTSPEKHSIYFFSDAAIIRPDSKRQLDTVIRILNSDLKKKINLVSQVGSTGSGKITLMGRSKNYFKVTDDVKVMKGSALRLSKERAETVRSYLMANGVEASRIKIPPAALLPLDRLSKKTKNSGVDIEIVNEN